MFHHRRLRVQRQQKLPTPSSCFSHRPELVAHVAGVRKSWLSTVDLVGRRSSSIKEQLSQWAAYRKGLRQLRKLLREVDPLLPPAGPLFCVLHQELSCYQVCCRTISSVGTITRKCNWLRLQVTVTRCNRSVTISISLPK